MKSLTLLFGFLLFANYEAKTNLDFTKGEKFSKYFDLDKVGSIRFENWHGNKVLNEKQQELMISYLETYVCDGSYAHTAPGHLNGQLRFKDGMKLNFYSNAESEIIIRQNNSLYYTFLSSKRINFENF